MARLFARVLVAYYGFAIAEVKSDCSRGDSSCAAGLQEETPVLQTQQGGSQERVVHEILKRCLQKGKDCGRLLAKSYHPFMKRCAVDDDLDSDDFAGCLRTLQEILILGSCTANDVVHVTMDKCQSLLDLLVFNEPVPEGIIRTLATVQWQRLFIKAMEWQAAEASHDEGTYFLQPGRSQHGAKYGRIAFGHRVTLDEVNLGRFMGGINTSMAHVLLDEDYQLAAQTCLDEIGGELFNRMPLKYQAVAVDIAFVYGSTNDFKELVEALLNADRRSEVMNRKRIKKVLLKKPLIPRNEVLFKEFIKS